MSIAFDQTRDSSVAAAFIEARNFDAAERIAMARLSDDPQDLQGLTLLTRIAGKKPDHPLALRRVRRALAFHPTDLDLRTLEVFALLHLNRKRESREAIDSFGEDFFFAVRHVESLYVAKFGTVPEVRAAYRGSSEQDPDEYTWALSNAGGYLEADPYFREAIASGKDEFGLNFTYAFNALMLCRFGEARRYARKALAHRARRVEKRVIACSYLFCIPTIFLAHLVYVGWRMATGYFPTLAVCLIFALFAPVLYAPLAGFALGWAWFGLPFGKTIAVGSVAIHTLAMLSFEPRIAARLADRGKAVTVRGY